MKRTISTFLSVVIFLSILSVGLTVNAAASWVPYAEDVKINTVFSGTLTENQYEKRLSDGVYFRVYRFKVPQKGKVTFQFDAEKDLSYVFNYLFKSTDTGDWIAEIAPEMEYNTKRLSYYYKETLSLSAGTYYLYSRSYFVDDTNVDLDLYFDFTPSFPNTSISKIVKNKRAFKVFWSSASSVSGYQIQYSRKSNMRIAKIIMIKSQSKVSRKVKGLKKKKRYYVRVRTYKQMTVEGTLKTYYGKWSSKKSIKTK